MINRMLFFLLLCSFVFFSACSTDESDNCSMIQVNSRYEPFRGIVNVEGAILLIGSDGERTDFRSRESVLFKFPFEGNVLSRKLEEATSRIKGENRTVSSTENSLYIVNEVFEEKLSFKNSSSRLYKLDLEEFGVNEIYDFGNVLVKWLYFDNDSEGYAVVRFSNKASDSGILFTTNGGVSWDTLKIGKIIDQVFDSSETIHFIAQSETNYTNLIYTVDKSDRLVDSLNVDLDIKDFFVDTLGRYWLLGQSKGETVLKKLSGENLEDVFVFSGDTSIYPKSIYRFRDFISVLLGKSDEEALGGFGGSRDELWFSLDNGGTWKEQMLNDALYINNLTFDKDQMYLAYLGRGNLAVCNIK